MILNAIQPQTSDTDSNVTSVDEDSDSEEVQPPCKTGIDCLSIAIKFFEIESSTTEADISKFISFKRKVGKIQAGRTKQVSLSDFFFRNHEIPFALNWHRE